MKHLVIWLAWLCLAVSAAAMPATYVGEHSYTSLLEWAHNNGLTAVDSHRKGETVLTNRTARLSFTLESRTAQINGINVALSFPVTTVKNSVMISHLDLDSAIRPLVFPGAPKAGRRVRTICIDPGHGGKDSGNRVSWHYEKIYTMALATELGGQLKKMGYNVILTRTKDAFVELPVRPDIANRRDADLFVSLHFNATETGKDEVEGPETYCITPVGASSTNARGEGSDYGSTPANHVESKSLLLAYQVQKSIVRSLGVEDRSVRRARFAVLRDATMPAILVEGGYMTHPTEGRKIFDNGYRRQLAQAIVRGIQSYEKLTCLPAGEDATASNQ